MIGFTPFGHLAPANERCICSQNPTEGARGRSDTKKDQKNQHPITMGDGHRDACEDERKRRQEAQAKIARGTEGAREYQQLGILEALAKIPVHGH